MKNAGWCRSAAATGSSFLTRRNATLRPQAVGVVALDPGVRTFLTYFSETDCGKLGHHAFGRIQRLCHWLDDLISRTAKAPNRRKRRQMRSAQARMRQRITNLVDELHWQLAAG